MSKTFLMFISDFRFAFPQLSFVAFVITLLQSPPAFAQERIFQAGAVVMDITPEKFPVESAGSMGPRSSSVAHDPLNARCLVLDDGETQIAIAVCDHCMIPRKSSMRQGLRSNKPPVSRQPTFCAPPLTRIQA